VNTPATLNGQELELFRIGDYGEKGNYTAADMQGIVDRYEKTGETAIAIGHVVSDADPAYGWLQSLRFSGDRLYGTPHEVSPELDELHAQKKYKHRSAAFSRDKDGQLYLHHLAVLGAVPPHVKGLKPAKFSSDPYQEFALSEGDDMPVDEQQLKTSITEGITTYFSGLFGKKEPTALDVDAIVKRATDAAAATFSAELKTEREARVALESQLATQQKTFSDATTQTRASDAIAKLKAAGAWVPAYDRLGVPALFSALAGQAQVVKFSDGAKDVEQDPMTLFSNVLAAVGKIVPSGRMTSAEPGATSAAVPDANGATVDASSVAFSDMVTKHAADNKMTYPEAYKQLRDKRPHAGASAAGAV
jgi:hypothetical protein